MAMNRAQISRQRQMRTARHLRDHRPHFVLVEINHRDARARSPKGERHFAADAAGAAGKNHALALEARGQVPCHYALATLGGLKPAGSST